MPLNIPDETLDALIRRIFLIEDFTLGAERSGYLARYRGRLTAADSAAAYDQLAAALEPQHLTPLFREEDGRHAIYIVQGRPRPKPSNPWVNLVLFILTLLSVLLAGALYGMQGAMPTDPWQIVVLLFQRGWPFALSLIAILGAHEFGHYLAGRYHGVHVTLPYFIPMPLSPFGTMGAFINMKDSPKNRNHLLDISITGPLAGLAVSIPVLLLGLALSEAGQIVNDVPQGMQGMLEGNSLLYLFLKYLRFGMLLPAAPESLSGLQSALYWLRFFFTGTPMPYGALDVVLHPVAWAGWAGLLVTSLNLIPVGQLDGGHVMYLLIGAKKMRRALPFILGLMLFMGLFWSGWLFWAVLLFFMGRAHAEPLDTITPLTPGRRKLALAVFVIFLLTFTPVPLILYGAV